MLASSTTPPTTTNLRDKRGVLEWAFEAKPGEVKDISFAWRVRWPKDKGVVMCRAKREASRSGGPYRPPFYQAERYSFTAPVSDET